jgi:hypothetical protein
MNEVKAGQKVWVLCTDAHFPKSGQYEVDLVNDIAFSVSGLSFIFNKVSMSCIERYSISIVYTDPTEYQREYQKYAIEEMVKGRWVGDKPVTHKDLLTLMSTEELETIFHIYNKTFHAIDKDSSQTRSLRGYR